jgi:hypothetical protein
MRRGALSQADLWIETVDDNQNTAVYSFSPKQTLNDKRALECMQEGIIYSLFSKTRGE